jgi:hypothetical protein
MKVCSDVSCPGRMSVRMHDNHIVSLAAVFQNYDNWEPVVLKFHVWVKHVISLQQCKISKSLLMI